MKPFLGIVLLASISLPIYGQIRNAYIENDIAYIETTSNNSIKIGPANYLSISPDNKKVAFVLSNYQRDKDVVLLGTNYGKKYLFYSYDIGTGKIEILFEELNDYGGKIPWYEPVWSPDSLLVIMDAGTSPMRTKIAINIAVDPNSVFSFYTFGKDLFFINNGILVTEVNSGRSYYSPMLGVFSVSFIDYSGNIKKIFTGTANESYSIESVSDDKILIKHEQWEEVEPDKTGCPYKRTSMSFLSLDYSYNVQD